MLPLSHPILISATRTPLHTRSAVHEEIYGFEFKKIMTKYIIIVALEALNYGMLPSFAMIAYGQEYNAGEITFVQTFIGAAVLWLIVLIKNFRSNKCKLKINWKVLLAGSTMGISAYAYYLSVEYIPASLAIVLLMEVIWMSVFAEWLFFKKDLRVLNWLLLYLL